ncbi:MAG: aldehyde dehydrogenase [Rhodospirillales bacterium]|jgi:acyl-CoA reductase-like NAD-dependent aldehyde dehydrogenase|nr:aldehyde dehydrogenase [Rhodospirillales bacterium]
MLKTVSPIDGRIVVERPLAGAAEIEGALARARAAFPGWRATPIAERQAIVMRAIDHLVAQGDAIAAEITAQMGRPLRYTPGEVRGLAERARHMIEIAPASLATIEPPRSSGIKRWIRREPLGLVTVVAPWNYPFLTSVNAIIPALLAGNVVLLKPSHQTPLTAERYDEAFRAAGLPDFVFQHLFLSHDDTLRLVADARVDFVCFTGSVEGGHAVRQALAGRFTGAGLELGGKDPAYVRADAALDHAVEQLVDGAFFNSGQSCCGIERIYVHGDVYDEFVERFVALTEQYVLGDPRHADTTLGPMVRASAANFVRSQIDDAVRAGARALIDAARFPADRAGTAYLAPQVLVDVDHSMSVMRDESFGPVVGIQRVADDDAAVRMMNDSRFGLTASLWTGDAARAEQLAERIETGTVFLNRCDYLDPSLAWTGVKESGVGCTLSALGFEPLTRPKSFHFRHQVA